MEDRTNLKIAAILGGALLGAFLLAMMPVFAHDQDNIHPALTDEIVNLFNESFPDKKLIEEEKRWLIRGSIDEDTEERSLFHFYDPVYNRGRFTNFTSKDWALKEGIQANYSDFSYTRALNDYAKGDKKRSLIAFGHILHLLEDAGIPEYTRNDPHPQVLDLGNSYEHKMVKWNQQNFKIVSKLITRKEKPVNLPEMANYFYRVASYSNSNFFSENTIFSPEYSSPTVDVWEYKRWPVEKVTGYKKNKFGRFPLVEKNTSSSFYTIENMAILNSYWEQLSREVIISGAGALRLFLEEAEKLRQDYLANESNKKKGLFAQVLQVFGIKNSEDNKPETDVGNDRKSVTNAVRKSSSGAVSSAKITTQDVNRVTNIPTVGDSKVSPIMSPTMSPSPVSKLSLSPTVSPASTSSPQESIPPESKQITLFPAPETIPTRKIGKVVINEVAWAGTEASATDEWLELYNTEAEAVDISGWRLISEDESPNITFSEGTIILAGGFFLIERTNDDTIKDLYADLAVSFGQGGLNNTGEVIKLIDSAGIVTDTVGKTGELWFAGDTSGKYSMERVYVATTGDEISNWKNFSGAPSNHDANGNFINGTPKSANSPTVVTSSAGGSGGSSMSPSSTTSPPVSPPPSDTGVSVVINEIGWMGTATSSNDEWLELYNTTSQAVDLTGWTLSSLDGTPNITLSGTISGYGFYLLERTNDSVISDISAEKTYTGALSNAGEGLKLRDNLGNIKDSADFASGWPAGDNTAKSSMERINPSNSGDNSSNWSTNNGITKNGNDAGGGPINGTPKTQNSIFNNF